MSLRVRYAEADRLGRVHTSRYPVYMEMGRTEMLRQAGMAYRDLEAAGAFVVVARLHLACHKPVRYDDTLRLETVVTRATTARIDHHYRFVRDDVLVAEGDTTLACVSADGRAQRMPEALLALLDVKV